MKLHTTSEIISFARELENKSAGFYKDLSARYAGEAEIFLTFTKENDKYNKQVERAYYGVITDAIEGCFAFDTESDEYRINTGLAGVKSNLHALNRAVEIEKIIAKFYLDASEQSKSLMADIPRVFAMISRKRDSRISVLMSLLAKEQPRG